MGGRNEGHKNGKTKRGIPIKNFLVWKWREGISISAVCDIFKAWVSHLDFGQSTAHTQKYNNKKKGNPQFPLVKPVDDEKWSWLVCKMLIYCTLRDVKEVTNLWRKQGGGGGDWPLSLLCLPLNFLQDLFSFVPFFLIWIFKNICLVFQCGGQELKMGRICWGGEI